jgi:osmoprotectant transport system substrate-binding protein
VIRVRAILLLALAAFSVSLASCSSGSHREAAPDALHDDAITVGSFDFAESELLAQLYGQALERHGYDVRWALDLGSREFVAPALAAGLVELVPEYEGTAVGFLSLGRTAPGADAGQTHEALVHTLQGRDVTALASAPAQNANTFVVTRATADRYGLRDVSDVAKVAAELTFGGPPECPNRPLCLEGLQKVYGLHFDQVVTSLDAGGPVTRQALEDGYVDVALLFTSDPAIAGDDLVELTDDRRLQPAENVTPLIRNEVIERWGSELVDVVDSVSAALTTEQLRDLNARAEGGKADQVAAAWLEEHAIS